ncbi:MAG: hypothetical protein IJJ56_10995 [Prevotella sp.]|nr:hypothetical protein [Prevotella sp.]
MKKVFLSLFVAMLATVAVQAQQIAVVTGSTTKMCQTLKDAIEASDDGSVIYLPGGGFQIGDTVKIKKQVTIIGIGHKANSENADGNTVISGNLFFNEGSSGSAVMGCYISGNIYIGDDKASVNNVLVKYCNINSILVKNNTCTGTVINQNYIRSQSACSYAPVEFTNNVTSQIAYIKGGIVKNNIILAGSGSASLFEVSSSTIYNNFFNHSNTSSGGEVYNNISYGSFGDEYIDISKIELKTLFQKYNDGRISPASDFHFTDDYKQYSDIGIYGGTGFSDSGMAPVPFIMAKNIPDQTDAEGKLNIKIRVKASE